MDLLRSGFAQTCSQFPAVSNAGTSEPNAAHGVAFIDMHKLPLVNLCNGILSPFVLPTFTTSCGNMCHNLITCE